MFYPQKFIVHLKLIFASFESQCFQEACEILTSQSMDFDNVVSDYDSDDIFESEDESEPSKTKLLGSLVDHQIQKNREAQVVYRKKVEQQ